MTILRSLTVSNVRKIKSCIFTPDRNISVIVGRNGSGKTSLLEAISISSLGRSFRSVNIKSIINLEEQFLRVIADVELTKSNELYRIGIEKDSMTTKVKVNGEFIQSASQLSRLFPIVLINPDVHKLLEDGPRHRRKFLEFGVFHVEQQYQQTWLQYRNSLKQRNSALRMGLSAREVKVWDKSLVEYGDAIFNYQKDYLKCLMDAIQSFANQFNLDILRNIKCTLHSGWGKSDSFQKALNESWTRDKEMKFTQVGPHRADIKITLNNQHAKCIVSRGQQKYICALLMLAQASSIVKQKNITPVILIDDLAAELDVETRREFCLLIESLKLQTIVTAVEDNVLHFSNFTSFVIVDGVLKE